MKSRHVITVFILLFIVAACKKQNTDSLTYYFTFNIGTKIYSLDSAVVNIYTPNSATSSFEILGYTKSNYYRLNAFGYNPFDTNIVGTYLTIQNPEPKRLLTAGGFITTDVTDANLGNYPINYDGKYSFTINEKTDSYISGTFSGTLTSTSFKTVNISNGKFKLPY